MDEPITREEQFLAAIAEGSAKISAPITREETFLAAIAGEPVSAPAPITRTEQFLAAIMENAGGSKDKEALVKLLSRTIEEFEVPQEATVIGASAFNGCSKLARITIHDGVTSIKSYAFNACQVLKLSEIPVGITEIQANAFVLCKSITSLTFKGTPTTINATAFKNCDNLVTINAPWAEGEVENAPWGATNATINYNYTGG